MQPKRTQAQKLKSSADTQLQDTGLECPEEVSKMELSIPLD